MGAAREREEEGGETGEEEDEEDVAGSRAPWGSRRVTDLRGQAVSHRVHVVAGRRGAHEGVGVAGEAVAVGRQAVGGAALGAQAALVHGGRWQRLGSVQRAAL